MLHRFTVTLSEDQSYLEPFLINKKTENKVCLKHPWFKIVQKNNILHFITTRRIELVRNKTTFTTLIKNNLDENTYTATITPVTKHFPTFLRITEDNKIGVKKFLGLSKEFLIPIPSGLKAIEDQNTIVLESRNLNELKNFSANFIYFRKRYYKKKLDFRRITDHFIVEYRSKE